MRTSALGGWATGSLTWTPIDRGGPFEGTFVVNAAWRGPIGNNAAPSTFGLANLGSIWTIDRVLVDASRLEAVIEWTHFKPKQGIYLRGDEWYVFSRAGLIREIRAYYACPASAQPLRTHELGDFAYAERGYPLQPPPIRR